MNSEEFLGYAIKKLVAQDVTVNFNKRIKDSKYSYNYFDYITKKELIINYFNNSFDSWFPVFVHEYCHFLQWKNELSKWESYNKYLVSFGNYLDGKTSKINKKTIRKIQEVELDCDKKAIKLIKKNQFNIDLSKYIKESNYYILCYDFIIKYKKFFIPYKDNILELIPDKAFTLEDLDTFPAKDEVEQLYLEEFKNKYPYDAFIQ